MLISLPIQQATTGAHIFHVPVAFNTRLKSIKLVSGQALGTHGSAHLTIAVVAADGASTLASRTTNSSGGSALVAGTVENLTISNFDESPLLANEAYKVTTVLGGTLANAVDLMLMFELEAERSF